MLDRHLLKAEFEEELSPSVDVIEEIGLDEDGGNPGAFLAWEKIVARKDDLGCRQGSSKETE